MTLEEVIQICNGRFVEYHSFSAGAENQCVDLANKWLVEGLGLKAIIGTNAIDFPSKAVELNDMEWIPNTDEGIPDPGDLIIYEGKYGHIDIALEGCTQTKVVAFSQNYPTGSPCVVRTSSYLRPKVVGWLHPKKVTMDPLQACLVDREKFWKERDEARSQLEQQIIKTAAVESNYLQYVEAANQFLTDLEQALVIVSKKEDPTEDRIKGVMAAISELRQKAETPVLPPASVETKKPEPPKPCPVTEVDYLDLAPDEIRVLNIYHEVKRLKNYLVSLVK
jgi:hypothetical protein